MTWLFERISSLYTRAIDSFREGVYGIKHRDEYSIPKILACFLYLFSFILAHVVIVIAIVGVIMDPRVFISAITGSEPKSPWVFLPANMLATPKYENTLEMAPWVSFFYAAAMELGFAIGLFILFQRGHKARFVIGCIIFGLANAACPVVGILTRMITKTSSIREIAETLWVFILIGVILMSFICIGTEGMSAYFVWLIIGVIYILTFALFLALLAAIFALVNLIASRPEVPAEASNTGSSARSSSQQTSSSASREAAKKQERYDKLEREIDSHKQALDMHNKGKFGYGYIDPKAAQRKIKSLEKERDMLKK